MAVVADLPFPDIHDVLIAYLTDRLDVDVDTVTPEQITGPCIRVLRAGGEDDGITDYPQVSVETFDVSFDQARALGERARQELLVLGGQAVADVAGHASPVLVDACKTDTPPNPVPYDNPDVDRHTGFYRLALRRPRRPRP